MQRGSRSPALCRAPGSHRRVGHRGAFASQNLKYMKALNDPYVKALAAHRRELNASRIDLEREYVDTMASKLSCQRSGALATLNFRAGEKRPGAGSLPEANGRRPRLEDNSICENDSVKETEHEKVVMVPYYASAGNLAEDTSRSASSTGRPSMSPASQDLTAREDRGSGSESQSMGWLKTMSVLNALGRTSCPSWLALRP
ncbi:unnamed protein product [Durusdinium trenchii]|uniref:Uncharacterized protein n=2 Tax=Durusdinium trenchii TaxID=1381693 RepID=A0ABP0IKX5_9DINO